MKLNTKDKNKCGIYLIRNLMNGKIYIGKSINIYSRMKTHIGKLNMRCIKSENQHLINSWNKYGKDCFSYCVVEETTSDKLSERELYWINFYHSTDRDKGYNFRIDSSSGMIPDFETRNKLSIAQKKRFEDKSERDKLSIVAKKFWTENPEIKNQVSQKMRVIKQKFVFIKMSIDGKDLEKYNTMEELVENNPSYKWQNIYSVCNGYKPTIYGYKWRKEYKI